MTIRGLFSGVLLLAGLEVVTSSTQAASRFGSLLTGIADVFARIADPTVPAIPDLTGK